MFRKIFRKELSIIRDIAEEKDFSTILINKLIYEFNFHDNIKKENHKEMIYKKFNYFPSLCEKLRYALLKHNIHLIACPPRKLKELLCTKIDPTPKDELAFVYTIPFRTDSSASNASREFYIITCLDRI